MQGDRQWVVLLLTTRDEADMLQLNLAHHLRWGVDHIGVCDNNSSDHTQDVIASFGDRVTSLEFDDFSRRQQFRMRCLEQIASRVGHRPDWIGVSDTDEFFWAPAADPHALLRTVPSQIVAATACQKLFVPTETDAVDGPAVQRLLYRAATDDSPYHRSYREGKTFYRGGWLKQISSEHLCHEVPHPQWTFSESLVHHYMITDEDHFVDKVRRLPAWRRHSGVRSSRLYDRGFRALMGKPPKPFVADFKQLWWQILSQQGEPALRAYFRDQFRVSATDLDAAIEAGQLLYDCSFADYHAQMESNR